MGVHSEIVDVLAKNVGQFKKQPFNKVHLNGQEMHYLASVLDSGKVGSNGYFTEKCEAFLEEKYAVKRVHLTTSCTDALEAAAILTSVGPGDEVIVPSYTYTTTANAFASRGAYLKFVDSREDHPGIDENAIRNQLSSKTKAIVVMHYGGIACDMDVVLDIANEVGALVVEDAALSIGAYYKGDPLGTIGHLGAFSFHETKNITCGEGGALLVNDDSLIERSDFVVEKGTDRMAVVEGRRIKYDWVDLGSSHMPSELNAALLWAQLQDVDFLNEERMLAWGRYRVLLEALEKHDVMLPGVPEYANHNAHSFHLVTRSHNELLGLQSFLAQRGIETKQHYTALHASPYASNTYGNIDLINAEKYAARLLRLPMHSYLTKEDQAFISDQIHEYYRVN